MTKNKKNTGKLVLDRAVVVNLTVRSGVRAGRCNNSCVGACGRTSIISREP